MTSTDPNQRYRPVRRVLLGVLIANLTVTVIKITLGAVTGALAVVADGFHSLVDSSSNLIGLAAIRLAERSADERYPYGYQKYETLGALAIGGLLLAAVWEILQNVIERVLHGSQPEITWLTFGLMALTFPVNVLIVIFETRAGRRLNSEILLADATHTRTDLYVTASVILSMAGVWLGWGWVDLIVASGVVVLILRAAFQILKDAAGSLADVAVVDPEQVSEIAYAVPGVRYVHNIRSRGTSEAVFVDLHVKVDPAMSTAQAHAVASEVERRTRSGIPNVVDAIVHIEPARYEESSDWERIAYGLRQIADGMGLGLHDLHVHVGDGGDYFIDMDLEISGEVTLREAHTLAEEFEDRARGYWPETTHIHTHLEPISNTLLFPSEVEDSALEQEITQMLAEEDDVGKEVEIRVHKENGYLHVNLKLRMAPEISLTQAHTKVETLKRRMYARLPEIDRMVIRVEPMH